MTDNALFRLVYVSRNLLPRDLGEDAVHEILSGSRRRNAACDVTGALLFCEDCFAQVLEGPLDRVTETFERIQCDPRHEAVVVLEAGPVAERAFADWSMAYAGRSRAPGSDFASLTGAGGGRRVLDLLQGAVVQLQAA